LESSKKDKRELPQAALSPLVTFPQKKRDRWGVRPGRKTRLDAPAIFGLRAGLGAGQLGSARAPSQVVQ
jgi:hypothetical protein